MSTGIDKLPTRLEPYLRMRKGNAPVLITRGSFRLVGRTSVDLRGRLYHRWLPSNAIAFEGSQEGGIVDLSDDWTLAWGSRVRHELPILVTSASVGPAKGPVRGILTAALSYGRVPFEELRFCLCNFPPFLGGPVRYGSGPFPGVVAGRLDVSSEIGRLILDPMPDPERSPGREEPTRPYLLSHVGRWTAPSGAMSETQIDVALELLHYWFGLLRGGWSGPIFPQGLAKGRVVWRQFAGWRLSEPKVIGSWMPTNNRLDLSALFLGFVGRWLDPVWRPAMKMSLAWLVEANKDRLANEARIVLGQVSLERLAWSYLVLDKKKLSESGFLSRTAAANIRALFDELCVPTHLPEHLDRLREFAGARDGPEMITTLRNMLVHPKNKQVVQDGVVLYECGQLALECVELTFLALCGYKGHYSRRGWKGWKGDDEVLVPWP